MVCFALALLLHYTVHRRVALKGESAGLGKLVGAVSLLLWAGLIFGGIFIAFTGQM